MGRDEPVDRSERGQRRRPGDRRTTRPRWSSSPGSTAPTWTSSSRRPPATRSLRGSVTGGDIGRLPAGRRSRRAARPTRLTGTNIYRFYLTGDFAAGAAIVTLLPGAWSDTGGASGAVRWHVHRGSTPAPRCSAPATAGRRRHGGGGGVDIDVANGALDSGRHYIDVNCRPAERRRSTTTPVMDAAQEIAVSGSGVGGVTVTLEGPDADRAASPTTTAVLCARPTRSP